MKITESMISIFLLRINVINTLEDNFYVDLCRGEQNIIFKEADAIFSLNSNRNISPCSNDQNNVNIISCVKYHVPDRFQNGTTNDDVPQMAINYQIGGKEKEIVITESDACLLYRTPTMNQKYTLYRAEIFVHQLTAEKMNHVMDSVISKMISKKQEIMVNIIKIDGDRVLFEIGSKSFCPRQAIPIYDYTFLDKDNCSSQSDIRDLILEHSTDNQKAQIYGSDINSIENFILSSICYSIILISVLVIAIATYRVTVYDHAFHFGEKFGYIFFCFIALSRTFLTVALMNEYELAPHQSVVVNIFWKFFMTIDSMYVVVYLLLVLRRIRNCSISGGEHYITSRFSTHMSYLWISQIPKQFIFYAYTTLFASSFGNIPTSILVNIWFEFVCSICLCCIVISDFKTFWKEVPRYITNKCRTKFINCCMFFSLGAEIVITFCIWGMTNLRQLIIHQKNTTTFYDSTSTSAKTNGHGIYFSFKDNKYTRDTKQYLVLDDYLKENFQPRYNTCLDVDFMPAPMTSECLNEVELGLFSLMGLVWITALTSSIYYMFITNMNFKLISRSFKDLDNITDNWPFSTSHIASNKLEGWNDNINSYGRASQVNSESPNRIAFK